MKESEAYDSLGMVELDAPGKTLLGDEAEGGDGELIKLSGRSTALAGKLGPSGVWSLEFGVCSLQSGVSLHKAMTIDLTSLGIKCIFAE